MRICVIPASFFFFLHGFGGIAQGLHEIAAILLKVLVQGMGAEEFFAFVVGTIFVQLVQQLRLAAITFRGVGEIEQKEEFGAPLRLNKTYLIFVSCPLDVMSPLKSTLEIFIRLPFFAFFLVLEV